MPPAPPALATHVQDELTATRVQEGAPFNISTAIDDPQAVPKSEWGDGPWQSEPDELAFEHRGYPCLIMRNRAGTLSGYIALPANHPWHGKEQEAIDEQVQVHGGITWAGESDMFRHTARWSDAWWIGFDTAHFGDVMPAHEAVMQKILGHPSGLSQLGMHTYKTLDYVREEVIGLAEQARQRDG
jgi:hypothetical protein